MTMRDARTPNPEPRKLPTWAEERARHRKAANVALRSITHILENGDTENWVSVMSQAHELLLEATKVDTIDRLKNLKVT